MHSRFGVLPLRTSLHRLYYEHCWKFQNRQYVSRAVIPSSNHHRLDLSKNLPIDTLEHSRVPGYNIFHTRD